MGWSHRRDQRGIALLTATVAALVISITALVVLNLTMRRFALSAQRSDRAITRICAEAGFQYAFTRLDTDPAFGNTVRNNSPYVISPLAVGAVITVPYNGGAPRNFTVDEQVPAALRMGWNDSAPPRRPRRDVHVLLEVFPENPAVVPSRLRIHAYSDYDTGV